MRVLLAAASVLLVIPAIKAGDKTVPRYIEFRDGSVLQMAVVDEDWPITIIRPNGAVEKKKVPLSSFPHFILTPEKGFAKKQALLTAVRKLGSEDFYDREIAFTELRKLGPEIRPDLETCLRLTSDLEAVTRLKRLLAAFPAKANTDQPSSVLFDLFQHKEQCWGHLGDEGIPVLYQGKTYRLSRADVRGLSVDVPPRLAGLTPPRIGAGGVRRLGPGDFPSGCVEEGFEQAPDGRPLQVGDNVEKLFVKKGFLLATVVANSFVAVNSFTVTGKSRGLSVANHQPLWEGEVSIRFVLPGRPEVPAGVTHFGCYIAAVVPKGTALVAEDLQGRELGRVETQINGHDFLGIHSPIPIHKIRFVPNPQLDRDFTLDDFIFTPPQTLEAGHSERFTAYLEEGRVYASDVEFTRETVLLRGMPGGLPDGRVPHGKVWRINVPEKDLPLAAPGAGVFAELPDGSVLFGACPPGMRGQPVFARRPKLLQQRDQVVGLWRSDGARLVPAAKPAGAVLWDAGQRRWLDVQHVRFLEEIVIWKVKDEFHNAPYAKAGPLWLTPPREHLPAGSWQIRTRAGDELVLSPKDPLGGKMSAGLEATWQGQNLRLAGQEIRAISRVGEPVPVKKTGP